MHLLMVRSIWSLCVHRSVRADTGLRSVVSSVAAVIQFVVAVYTVSDRTADTWRIKLNDCSVRLAIRSTQDSCQHC